MGRRVEEEEKKKKNLKKAFKCPPPRKRKGKGKGERGSFVCLPTPPPSFLLLNKVFLGFVIMENIYIYISTFIYIHMVCLCVCVGFFPSQSWGGWAPGLFLRQRQSKESKKEMTTT